MLVGLVLFVSSISSVLGPLHASSPEVNITAVDSYVSCTSAGRILCNLHLIFEFIQQLTVGPACQILLVVITFAPALWSAQLL